MSLELSILTAHMPRIYNEEKVPDFQQALVKSMHGLSEKIKEVDTDVAIIVSCHWESTFHHFVDATERHKGVLTAFECPELINDAHYDYKGDKELAELLVKAGQEAGIQVLPVDDPTYVWDYGTVVPLKYLIPKEDIPVIDLSVTYAASLEETYKWGQAIGKVLRKTDKKVTFISSGALAHNLVRGPHLMPTKTEYALDQQFIDYLLDKDYKSAWEMLPQYSKVAKVEADGRHLAMLLGVIGEECDSEFLSYAQSSGSGNAIMTFTPLLTGSKTPTSRFVQTRR